MPERVKSNAVNNSIRFTSISLTKLTKTQLIDFANRICKVNNYSYLCDAKRTEQSTQDISFRPHKSGVPGAVPFFGSVRFANTKGASLFLYIYVK